MSGDKKASKGAQMRKPGPTGSSSAPPLSVPGMGDSPYELTFSRTFLWERILSGLEASEAVKETVSERQVQAGHPEFSVASGLLSLPTTDRKVHAVMALYLDYEELVRSEWKGLKKGLRGVLTGEAVRQVEEKTSQLEGLKHALRLASKEERSRYESQLGLLYYQWLRPFYYVAGIVNPAEELEKLDPDFRFLGEDIGGAHPDLVQILLKTEKILDEMGRKQVVIDSTRSCWAFTPRPTNNLTGLSNHALGRAIDVEVRREPDIQDENTTLANDVRSAFKKAGAVLKPHDRSGLESQISKDTMHFEALDSEPPVRHLQRARLSFADWLANTAGSVGPGAAL
jgi:hypothetical protein